jgi:hypothetical protein
MGRERGRWQLVTIMEAMFEVLCEGCGRAHGVFLCYQLVAGRGLSGDLWMLTSSHGGSLVGVGRSLDRGCA